MDAASTLPEATGLHADIRISTPDYFRAMSIPLLKGRTFTDSDRDNALNLAIVNDALARTVFPGQDPIGKQLTNFGPDAITLQIIGVIGNVRHVGLDTAPNPEIYQLLGQAQWPSMFFAIRSVTSDPASLTSAAQKVVWNINKDVPLAYTRTMQDLIANSVQRRRFSMLLLTIFAATAMLLAASDSTESCRTQLPSERKKSASAWRSGPGVPMCWHSS